MVADSCSVLLPQFVHALFPVYSIDCRSSLYDIVCNRFTFCSAPISCCLFVPVLFTLCSGSVPRAGGEHEQNVNKQGTNEQHQGHNVNTLHRSVPIPFTICSPFVHVLFPVCSQCVPVPFSKRPGACAPQSHILLILQPVLTQAEKYLSHIVFCRIRHLFLT